MKTLLYYSDLDDVNSYQIQLQLEDKQVKLRDAGMFEENVREHADEAFITPEVDDEIKERIVTHLSKVMEVFLINADPNEIELDDTGEENTVLDDQEDEFFNEPDEDALKAELENKKQAAKDADEKAAKERAEAEAAELKAQAENIEADQAEAEAETAKEELEEAESELTRLDMITELREREITIPRNATKAQVQELYNEHVVNVDSRD